MTVVVVTLNGRLMSVHATEAGADAAMAAYRAARTGDIWRQVHAGAWSSIQTTSLARRTMQVEP